MKVVMVKDLKDQIGTPEPRPILICSRCGAEYSAHAGDYFFAPPTTILRCCKRPLALVVRRVTHEEVKP